MPKLEKYIDGITDVHVTLSAEKYRQIAEINVHSRGKLYLSAKEASDQLKTSVQQALEKIAGQAKKKHEKRIDRKTAGGESDRGRGDVRPDRRRRRPAAAGRRRGSSRAAAFSSSL